MFEELQVRTTFPDQNLKFLDFKSNGLVCHISIEGFIMDAFAAFKGRFTKEDYNRVTKLYGQPQKMVKEEKKREIKHSPDPDPNAFCQVIREYYLSMETCRFEENPSQILWQYGDWIIALNFLREHELFSVKLFQSGSNLNADGIYDL